MIRKNRLSFGVILPLLCLAPEVRAQVPNFDTLYTDLGDDDFEKREKATASLIKQAANLSNAQIGKLQTAIANRTFETDFEIANRAGRVLRGGFATRLRGSPTVGENLIITVDAANGKIYIGNAVGTFDKNNAATLAAMNALQTASQNLVVSSLKGQLAQSKTNYDAIRKLIRAQGAAGIDGLNLKQGTDDVKYKDLLSRMLDAETAIRGSE